MVVASLKISEFRQIVWSARDKNTNLNQPKVRLVPFRDAWIAHTKESISTDEARELLKRDSFMTLVEKDTWLLRWPELLTIGSQWENPRLGVYELSEKKARLLVLSAVQPIFSGHPILRVDMPGLLTSFDPYVKSAWERLGTIV